MINFICGALIMWFALGMIIYFAELYLNQEEEWDKWFYIFVMLPFLAVAFPCALIAEGATKLKETIRFKWDYDWRIKINKIRIKFQNRS